MGVSFTPKQQQAIDVQGCNVLVSAAAGSGKTAVLTQRILGMISDPHHPVNIDRLLVVTFTNAAAAQMRERIGIAIADRLELEPENEHLQKQSALVHNAQITTIDSFCMFVIRNNFNDIGLDPGFRVADEGERKLLLKEVMEELLEEEFANGGEAFLDCVEYFSTGSKDQAIEEHILKLFEFAMSNPWPEQWLEERKQDYDLSAPGDLEQADFVRYGLSQAGQLLADCVDKLSDCLDICGEPDGPYMYAELLEKEKEQIEKLLPLNSYGEGYGRLGSINFGRLPSKKDDSVALYKRELVQKMRKDVKELVTFVKESFFPASADRLTKHMQGSHPAVCLLVELTKKFRKAFADKKRQANILDFDDIEHFALSILTVKDEKGCHPTPTAMDYRAYFTEILIDEYQDSNLVQEYLLCSISGEEEGRHNRFMVGDVKQSIYKFRLARPEIFMEKYDAYSGEGANIKIDLNQNFRSRGQVIESVNSVFSKIMGKSLGGVVYDDDAALYPGARYPAWESKKETGAAEILLVSGSMAGGDTQEKGEREGAKISQKKKEAYAVAARIKELAGHFPVTDPVNAKLRPASYKDIVILLRSNAGWDEEFREVFKEEGIPAHASSRTGYFSAPEIGCLLQLLRVLNNPMQDIPLFGVLKSFFGMLEDEEIAMIRASQEDKKQLFYDGLKEFAQSGEGDLAEKVRHFLGFIEENRDRAIYLPIHDLIREILADSGYIRYVSALPGGEQRRANVEILLEKAVAFQKTSYYGLFHFIRYIEQLEKYDVDYGEANILDENADVVRIMSIHKSKGLEFPICFVCGLSKRFNMQDVSGRLIADVDMGIGVDYVNHKERYLTGTLRKNIIAGKLKQDNLGEELRVLYVAMTRAKEKLIMTGYMKEPAARLKPLLQFSRSRREIVPYSDLLSASDYFDFILPALADHPDFAPVFAQLGLEENADKGGVSPGIFRISILDERELVRQELKEQLRTEDLKRRLLLSDPVTDSDNTLMTYLSKKLEYCYEHSNLQGLYTKTTVSELKKAGHTEELDFSAKLFREPEIIPYLPRFVQTKESLGGAGRGSAFHKVMELMDFAALLSKSSLHDGLEQMIGDMVKQGRLEEEYAAAIQLPLVEAFFTSKLAIRMAQAQERGGLHKEQPFVLGLSASELNESFPAQETVLIQGIIDVYFEEEGKLVVADYKTDRVKTPGELVEKYKIQLDYYAQALERLTGRQVKEKIIYSFGLRQEIVV